MPDMDTPDGFPDPQETDKPRRPPTRPYPTTLQVLKVGAHSQPHLVAGAIAACIRRFGRAEVVAIGAGAINQAVKSIAVAHLYMWEEFVEIVCVPSFVDIEITHTERTAMLFSVTPRNP